MHKPIMFGHALTLTDSDW